MKFLSKKKVLFLLAFWLLRAAVAFAYEVVEVKQGGTLRGLVKFPGETAPRAMFGTRGDPLCPAGVAQEHLLVKQENRGIKNALVVLEIQKGKAFTPFQATLDNKGCRFAPRMQWMRKSANLQLTNSDPTVHNVHALRNNVTTFSVDVAPKGGPSARRPLVDVGLYKMNCDRHLWMRAWVYVSDHPYVAITDAEGRFEMKDIPAGTYTAQVWHEGWEEKGTEATGQLLYHPVEQVLKVKIIRDDVTEVLFDTLKPTFLYAK